MGFIAHEKFSELTVKMTVVIWLPGTLRRGLLWSPRVQDHHSLTEWRVDPALLWGINQSYPAALKARPSSTFNIKLWSHWAVTAATFQTIQLWKLEASLCVKQNSVHVIIMTPRHLHELILVYRHLYLFVWILIRTKRFCISCRWIIPLEGKLFSPSVFT